MEHGINKALLDLSIEDLRQLVGNKILGRGRSYVKNVYELSRTEGGGLLGRVSGSEEYITWVDMDENKALAWFCNCPYDWGVCKHVVALIFAGLKEVKAGKKIPLADLDSDKYQVAFSKDEDVFDEYDDDFGVLDTGALQKMLNEKSKKELTAMLLDFAGRYPEVRRDILERQQLQGGEIEKLVRSLSNEIEAVASEDGWYNSWKDEGHLPDYSHIREQLIALFTSGYVDEVVALGRQLWEQGNEQVENSHDNGETADEVAASMDVVFEAVQESSLSCAEQLLWVIDIFLEDQYSISSGGQAVVDSSTYAQTDWHEVAEVLEDRLQKAPTPKGDAFSARYYRRELMNWLIESYRKSGQKEKIIPLLESEVHHVLCYEQLVDVLLTEGRVAEAGQWCRTGFNKTKKSASGIANALQEKLRKMAELEERSEMVAAYRAEDFFKYPSLKSYLKVQEAAEKNDCWGCIRPMIFDYLQKGQRPDASNGWPLPEPEVIARESRGYRGEFPYIGVLIDIAIHEKRLDDVVALYRSRNPKKKWPGSKDQEIAKAVTYSHPEVALTIWKQLVLAQIELTKPAAYNVAASYLKKMSEIYKRIDHVDGWQKLLVGIRQEHKRKRRLMEVLDSLEGKRIVD